MPVDPAFDCGLRRCLAAWDLPISDAAVDLLWRHFELVIEKNAVMNLTRITEPAEAAVKHYADSLSIVAWEAPAHTQDNEIEASPRREGAHSRLDRPVRTVLDVGTGAGFPAVPLAVMRPDWTVTAIDGTRKKVDFVASVATTLGLTNLQAIHAHTAHWETGRRFDLVTFRALAKLPAAIAECGRFVAPGGRLIAFSTASGAAKDDLAPPALANARLKACPPFAYELMDDEEAIRRALLVFRKMS